MDQILQNIPFCYCLLDDILITGRNDAEHLEIFDKVFGALPAIGLRLTYIDKCSFPKDRLQDYGHILTKDGIPSPAKTEAIVNALVPQNVS